MRHRYPLLAVLVVVALALVVAPAFAAKPAPTRTALQGTPQRILVATPQNVNATCTLGVTDTPAWIVDFLSPPDDGYYTLLDPAVCGCTGPGGVLLSNAHVMLNFPVACGIPIQVGVVEANLADPACPVPVPGAYLCEPLQYLLQPGAAGNYNFTIPVNAGCCITAPAFLEVTFLTAGDCATLPRLITSDICNNCWSWNLWNSGLADLCFDYGFPGNPVMYVDAACCDVVPTTHQTWGRLKTMYR